MLLEVADVHIVHNPSNHDFISGFMLADSIYCCLEKVKMLRLMLRINTESITNMEGT